MSLPMWKLVESKCYLLGNLVVLVKLLPTSAKVLSSTPFLFSFFFFYPQVKILIHE